MNNHPGGEFLLFSKSFRRKYWGKTCKIHLSTNIHNNTLQKNWNEIQNTASIPLIFGTWNLKVLFQKHQVESVDYNTIECCRWDTKLESGDSTIARVGWPNLGVGHTTSIFTKDGNPSCGLWNGCFTTRGTCQPRNPLAIVVSRFPTGQTWRLPELVDKGSHYYGDWHT